MIALVIGKWHRLPIIVDDASSGMKIEIADRITLFKDTDQCLGFLFTGGILAELLLNVGFAWKIPVDIDLLALYFQ